MDNLENLYKKSFEDFERKPKGDFWNRLEPIIPPRPLRYNDKFLLFIAYFSGVLSMLLIVLGYQFFTQQPSNSLLSAFPIDLEGATKAPRTLPNENIATTQTIALAIPSAKPRRQIAQANKFKASQLPLVFETELTATNTAGQIDENKLINDRFSAEKLDSSNFRKSTLSVFAKKLDIPFLQKDYYLSLPRGSQLFINRKEQKKKQKKDLPNVIEYAFLGVQYTPISLGSIKIEDHINGITFSQNVGINRTKGYDINIGIQLKNNWFIQTGFTNHQYFLQQTNQHSILTNYTNAVTVENGIIQTYTFTGQPIIEPIQTKVEVLSQAGDFVNGEAFVVQSTTQQQLKFSSIYTQIGYRFPLNPRWQLIPKVGLSAAWAEKGKVELTNTNLLDTRQSLLTTSIDNTNVTTSNFIEGLLSTELVYRHSKRISFTGSPHFRFGFKPFFDNYQRSTKHRFGQLQFGIRIHLY